MALFPQFCYYLGLSCQELQLIDLAHQSASLNCYSK
jgi:hypothetical protein